MEEKKRKVEESEKQIFDDSLKKYDQSLITQQRVIKFFKDFHQKTCKTNAEFNKYDQLIPFIEESLKNIQRNDAYSFLLKQAKTNIIDSGLLDSISLLLSMITESDICLEKEHENKSFTIAILKPGFTHLEKEIEKAMKWNHFTIEQKITKKYDVDIWKKFYAEHAKRDSFGSLIEYMAEEEVIVYELSQNGPDAIPHWRYMIGPTAAGLSDEPIYCLRGVYGDHLDIKKNGFHGSDSAESYASEKKFFFNK